uniref:(northern house mosquito) hypothetical protein n=1 Tax=Culex pipiens TaxID=7175 RepID=A0A8D8B0F1_CULPI
MDTKESTAAKPATSGFMFGSVTPAQQTRRRQQTRQWHRLQRQPNHLTRQVPRFGSTSSTPGTGFSFAKVAKPTKDSKPDGMATADAKPCKVEFTPVKVNDSIFPKRCKLFVKADGKR